MATPLTKKDVKLIWDNDYEQAFLAFKKSLVQLPVLAYHTRDGPFIPSTDVSDTGMRAVLEHEQEEDGRMVKTLYSDPGKEFTTVLHQEVCDLLHTAKTYSTAYRLQVNGMVQQCNYTLLAMLRAVVAEQQDDWHDQPLALLVAYHSERHSSTGITSCCMIYGIEMAMPLDLVIGDIGREWPNIHYPPVYMEWLRGSIRDAHAMARTNFKKAAKHQKRGYGKTSRTAVLQRGGLAWCVYPPVSGGKLQYRNRGT